MKHSTHYPFPKVGAATRLATALSVATAMILHKIDVFCLVTAAQP
jgi:hypothetical protein